MRRFPVTGLQQPHIYSVTVSAVFSSAGVSSTFTDTAGPALQSSSDAPSLSRALSSMPGRFLTSPPLVSVMRNAKTF